MDDVEVDETFVAGPDTFNDVQSISEVSFPVQDPSTAELAERLEQELARVDEQLGEMESGDHDTDAAGEESEAPTSPVRTATDLLAAWPPVACD